MSAVRLGALGTICPHGPVSRNRATEAASESFARAAVDQHSVRVCGDPAKSLHALGVRRSWVYGCVRSAGVCQMTEDERQRFVSQCVPTRADFEALAARLGVKPLPARKVGLVCARKAHKMQRVITRWNGAETINDARPGDFIVTNLAADGKPLRDADRNLNTYVVRVERFAELYEPTGERARVGMIYRAKGVVHAIKLDNGFDILAPWGERQCADSGFLLLNGDEVYGNHAETFAATYEVLAP